MNFLKLALMSFIDDHVNQRWCERRDLATTTKFLKRKTVTWEDRGKFYLQPESPAEDFPEAPTLPSRAALPAPSSTSPFGTSAPLQKHLERTNTSGRGVEVLKQLEAQEEKYGPPLDEPTRGRTKD